ncbi:hypothetical protein [Aquimarina spongiae]|uniref:Uncharacterized protein n=1 Tax=Aquimarina spongiae TaxID=570521 RepID=A0A1M6JGB1_9FLAO|nr:hypothetical protein [Aquimarina spongiae]SHJ45695.1 hypothetical protein SAMN04488508_10950 [Aquimarina spongiae]
MKTSTTIELKETLKNLGDKFDNDEIIKRFQESSNEFDLMIKKGLAKRRGNNIYSSIDKGTNVVMFNR